MGFFDRFKKKIEDINNNDADIEELDQEFYIDDKEMAHDEWISMAQNILINSVKAVSKECERAFVLINFKTPEFKVIYQIDKKIVSIYQLKDDYQEKLRSQLLPQAESVVDYINETQSDAGLVVFDYVELQFETASNAWFSHIIWDEENEISSFDDLYDGWFELLSQVAPNQALDSDVSLPWYPEV